MLCSQLHEFLSTLGMCNQVIPTKLLILIITPLLTVINRELLSMQVLCCLQLDSQLPYFMHLCIRALHKMNKIVLLSRHFCQLSYLINVSLILAHSCFLGLMLFEEQISVWLLTLAICSLSHTQGGFGLY